MRQDFVVESYPVWHCWPERGNHTRLGDEIRSKHRNWQYGGTYTKKQLAGYVWTDRPRVRARWDALPDDAVFACEHDGVFAYFTLEDVDDDPLVDAGGAQAAVFQLRDAGWSLRRIAQSAEVSYDVVGRLASGSARRRIRASTEEAVLGLAESVNGSTAA